jgi:probable DNA metabolism protein
MVYLHDGSFEGVLSGIYTMFYSKASVEEGELVAKDSYQQTFFTLTLPVVTNREFAYKVAKSIYEHFGQEGFKCVYQAYLAEDEAYGTTLFRALKVAYKLGGHAFEALHYPDILKLNQWSTRVAREAHLFLGLLRFAELDNGLYYAPFEPTLNIIGLLTSHFSQRLADQSWVIHDTKRKIGAFYDQETVVLNTLLEIPTLVYSDREVDFQTLWREYVAHIAIEARTNPKCQQQHMPKKYWKFLTEKNVVNFVENTH